MARRPRDLRDEDPGLPSQLFVSYLAPESVPAPERSLVIDLRTNYRVA